MQQIIGRMITTFFQPMTRSHRKCVATTNGTIAPVVGVVIVCLILSLSLQNYLLEQSLSHHLLSVPKVPE